MYRPIPRGQITDTLAQLRDLFRRIKPSNETETRAKQRRETLAKNLLSNLTRTNEHPTLHTVLEIADTFSLTLGDYIIPQIIGSSRLFIGQAVYAQQGTAGNVPLAAAFSVVPIVIMAIYLWIAKKQGAFDAL